VSRQGSTDYSGTPLSKKLGLGRGRRLWVASAPYPPVKADLGDLINEYPPTRRPADADVLLQFTTSREWLRSHFEFLRAAVKTDGALWIAWPKKASKVNLELDNDLDFETVQRTGLDAGLVDNKSCSIDEDWQALRFVYRVRDRTR
jgi:hypothetical protein